MKNPRSMTAEQIEAARRMTIRSFFITGTVRSKCGGGTVYLLKNDARLAGAERYAKGFVGKSLKAAFYYRFKDEAAMTAHVEQFIKGIGEVNAFKAKRKAAKAATPNCLKVGDILISSWGYEQTNIDFYEVTRMVGKNSVEIREVAQRRNEDLAMQGDCAPVPGSYTGPAMVKRVNGTSVKIESFAHARLMQPTAVIGNVKTYAPARFTAYH